jgi:hypothetical protein
MKDTFYLYYPKYKVIQSHFDRCIEIHTTINGTFSRVLIRTNEKRMLKMRNLITDSKYIGVRYKSVIFCNFN